MNQGSQICYYCWSSEEETILWVDKGPPHREELVFLVAGQPCLARRLFNHTGHMEQVARDGLWEYSLMTTLSRNIWGFGLIYFPQQVCKWCIYKFQHPTTTPKFLFLTNYYKGLFIFLDHLAFDLFYFSMFSALPNIIHHYDIILSICPHGIDRFQLDGSEVRQSLKILRFFFLKLIQTKTPHLRGRGRSAFVIVL